MCTTKTYAHSLEVYISKMATNMATKTLKYISQLTGKLFKDKRRVDLDNIKVKGSIPRCGNSMKMQSFDMAANS